MLALVRVHREPGGGLVGPSGGSKRGLPDAASQGRSAVRRTRRHKGDSHMVIHSEHLDPRPTRDGLRCQQA
eukprot:5414625-Alexandrium_andersonii.AAC.1